MEEKARKVAELLKLLANEHRLLILCALADGAMNVTEIYAHTPGISLSALSQHLTLLRRVDILASEKRGLQVFYEIADRRVLSLLTVLKAEYC